VHDLDERLQQLVGQLDSPVETDGAVERVRARMARHRRERHLKTIGALVAAVAAVTLTLTQLVPSRDAGRDRVTLTGPREVTSTSAPAPSTTTPTPSTSTPAPDPSAVLLLRATAAWPAFVATLPSGSVASPVVTSADGPVGVTGGRDADIGLYRFAGAAWKLYARFPTWLPLAPGNALAGHVLAADVTGDGHDDFLALDFPGADHVGGSVLSAEGGHWHLVAFVGRGTYLTWLGLDDASFRARYGSVLMSLENDCTPDCAQGTISEDHWRFDRSSSTFVSVARHVKR
jgi:hypothetical protein